jgi:hypothetical protein
LLFQISNFVVSKGLAVRRNIFLILIMSLWVQQGFACHNSTLNSVSFVDNGNATCTLTIDAVGLGYYLTDKEVTAIGKFQ